MEWSFAGELRRDSASGHYNYGPLQIQPLTVQMRRFLSRDVPASFTERGFRVLPTVLHVDEVFTSTVQAMSLNDRDSGRLV